MCNIHLITLLFVFLTTSEAQYKGRRSQCGPEIFKCYDQHKFTMCSNGKPVGPVLSCPAGTVCFQDNEKICVETRKEEKPVHGSKANVIRCDNGYVIQVPRCVLQGRSIIGGTGCKKYVDCVQDVDGLTSMINECPENTFFDDDYSECELGYECKDKDFCAIKPKRIINPHQISDTYFTCENGNDVLLPNCDMRNEVYIAKTGCKKYLKCFDTLNGYLTKVFSCPDDTLFDPNSKKCSLSYKCEDVDNCLQLSLSMCRWDGKTYINGTLCRKYEFCRTGAEPVQYDCPETSLFDPKLSECTMDYICPETRTTFDLGHQRFGEPEQAKFQICKKLGNFSDNADTSCKKYFACNFDHRGILRSTMYECEEGTLFDPITKLCSSAYVCPLKDIQTGIQMRKIDVKFLSNGRCTTVGRFLVPNTNCKNYTLCRASVIGGLIGTQLKCPTTSVFDQSIQKCTASYICLENLCAGWLDAVANPNSKDCTSFVRCDFDEEGINYVGKVEYCPLNTYFDPERFFCDMNYKCQTK